MKLEEITEAFLKGLDADKGVFIVFRADNVHVIKLKTNNVESLGLLEMASMMVKKQMEIKDIK